MLCTNQADLISKMGSQLKKLREKRGITQNDFSIRIGVSHPSISRWENGKVPIPTQYIPLICNTLDCEVGYLFGEYDCSTKDIQGIADFLGLSENAISKLKELCSEYHEFGKYSNSLILSGLFDKALQCASSAIDPGLQKINNIMGDIRFLTEELEKVANPTFVQIQLREIYKNAENLSEIEALVDFLSEHITEKVLLNTLEFQEYELQQSSVYFRKAIEEIKEAQQRKQSGGVASDCSNLTQSRRLPS